MRLHVFLSGLVLLGLLLGACAPAAPGEKPLTAPSPTLVPAGPSPTARVAPAPAAAGASSEEKPKYGGILTTIRKQDPPHFDSQQSRSVHVGGAVGPAYNLLVKPDPTDPSRRRILPDLAESWEMSPDGKSYTFHLRKGVKFHDGTPLTSEDVVATLQRLISPPEGVPIHLNALFYPVESVAASDPYTVKFTLKRPYAIFLDVVAMPYNTIYPKHMLDKYGDMKKHVVGTGPFKFKEYIRGTVFELERNPSYFVSGRPYLDGVRGYVVPDFAAMRAAIATGQVLLQTKGTIYMRPSEQEALRRIAPQVRHNMDVYPGAWSLKPNTQRAPWNDVRVRKAASLAIDREAALKVLAEGLGGVWGGYLPPGEWALPWEGWESSPGFRKPKDQDIAEAKRLLTEAGYPKGFKTKILTRSTADWVGAAVFGVDQLAKVGIEATVDTKEVGGYYAYLAGGDFDLTVFQTSGAIADPDVVFASNFLTGSEMNPGKYSDPKVEELYLKQSMALDPAERRKLVNEMHRAALEGVPAIMYFWIGQTDAWWSQVKNYVSPAHSAYSFDFQDVWLAE